MDNHRHPGTRRTGTALTAGQPQRQLVGDLVESVLGRATGRAAASRADDRGTGLAQRGGDAPPCAAGGPSHHRDSTTERVTIRRPSHNPSLSDGYDSQTNIAALYASVMIVV